MSQSDTPGLVEGLLSDKILGDTQLASGDSMSIEAFDQLLLDLCREFRFDEVFERYKNDPDITQHKLFQSLGPWLVLVYSIVAIHRHHEPVRSLAELTQVTWSLLVACTVLLLAYRVLLWLGALFARKISIPPICPQDDDRL